MSGRAGCQAHFTPELGSAAGAGRQAGLAQRRCPQPGAVSSISHLETHLGCPDLDRVLLVSGKGGGASGF